MSSRYQFLWHLHHDVLLILWMCMVLRATIDTTQPKNIAAQHTSNHRLAIEANSWSIIPIPRYSIYVTFTLTNRVIHKVSQRCMDKTMTLILHWEFFFFQKLHSLLCAGDYFESWVEFLWTSSISQRLPHFVALGNQHVWHHLDVIIVP